MFCMIQAKQKDRLSDVILSHQGVAASALLWGAAGSLLCSQVPLAVADSLEAAAAGLKPGM